MMGDGFEHDLPLSGLWVLPVAKQLSQCLHVGRARAVNSPASFDQLFTKL